MSAPIAHAEVLLDAQQHSAALGVLEPHLASAPDDSHALCLAARAYLGLDDAARALSAAGRAAQLEPDEEWPLRLVSIAEMRLGHFIAAATAADAAVRVAPFAWQTHQQRAQVDVAAERVTEQTWTMANEAVRLGPNEAQTHRLIGVVALELRRYDIAEQALRASLRLDPHDTLAAHELARLHLRRRNLGAAAAGFADVAAADPAAKVAAYNLTVVGAAGLRYVHLVLWAALFLAARVDDVNSTAGHLMLAVATGLAAAVIGWFGWRVQRQSHGRSLRLLKIVLRLDRLLAAWAGCLALGFLGMVLAAIGRPAVLGQVGLGLAIGGVLLGTIFSWVRAARLRRRARS